MERTEVNAERTGDLSRTTHFHTLLVEAGVGVVFSEDTRSKVTTEVGKRLTVLVVEVTDGIACPLIVTERNHTLKVEPTNRTIAEVGLNAHVARVNALHIEVVAVAGMVARSDFSTASCSFIHPLGVVGIDIGRENSALEAVTNLERHNLLVYGIGVSGIADGRRKECTTREERSTADEACIEEHVVVAVDVVVRTTLDCTTKCIDSSRLSMSFIVVEAIYTPIACVVDRTCKHEVELFVEHIVLCLSKSALLEHVTIVVAINDIANTEFLIFPHWVGSNGVVSCIYILTA